MKRPIIYPDPQVDSFTRRVRAVFGALLGLLVFAGVWFHWGPFTASEGVVVLLASVAACVVGAVRYGDPFWIGVIRFFR